MRHLLDFWRGGAALLLATLLLGLWPGQGEATPLYMARSGRTCDNCHSLPNSWYDPADWWMRKCTLSCSSCHVDPSGGGLRNVSGRYFSEATLPMFASLRRPLEDVPRDLVGSVRGWLTGQGGPEGVPESKPSSESSSGPVQPDSEQRDPRPPGSPPAEDGPGWGAPLGTPGAMAWLPGRYAKLKARPLLLLGGDARLAYWQQGPLFFPMQADAYAAVQPMSHLSVSTSVGLRGRRGQPLRATRASWEPQDPSVVQVKDLWVMTHEWPMLSYLRAGRFLPGFGTRIADHTAPVRRAFGLSQETPDTRVLGAELGFTANYPYANASVFKPVEPGGLNPVDSAPGLGGVVSAGWRDLGWSLGGSAMLRRRPERLGGDTTDLSLQWSWNPWFYWEGLPVTYLGEVAWGQLQRPYSGEVTTQIAWYHRLSWLPFNGLTLDLRHDFWDPDSEVSGDEMLRPGVGAEWVIWSGLALRADARYGLVAEGDGRADLFMQLHGWF